MNSSANSRSFSDHRFENSNSCCGHAFSLRSTSTALYCLMMASICNKAIADIRLRTLVQCCPQWVSFSDYHSEN